MIDAPARPVSIDTDPGIDDALALLFAWGSPEIAVETVTTVAGNTRAEQGTTNVFRLLALRRPLPSPEVAMGAIAPLARPLVTEARYHGADGLGDLSDWPPVTVERRPGGATSLLLDTMRRHRDRLTLVALGPLTNLALALEADAAAVRGVGRVVAMGGAADVTGNVREDTEYNMFVDPEAAQHVLTAGLPLDLVPLDATRQAVLDRAALHAALARRPGPLADRIAAFTARAFRIDGHRMYLHDPLAVACAIDPGYVTWERACLSVGPDGQTRRAQGAPNCRLARVVDVPRFLTSFLDRLCPASS